MPISTMLILIAAVGLFALFAIALAYTQFHARNLMIGSTVTEAAHRQRRRPF